MAEIVDPAVERRWEGVPLNARPGGWKNWDYTQVRRWKEAHKRRVIKARMWRRRIAELARYERVKDMHIPVSALSSRQVNIEATYGPLAGRPSCTILVWFGTREWEDPDTRMKTSAFDGQRQRTMGSIPNTLHETPAVFTSSVGTEMGPRSFLIQVFKVIGFFGGNAKVTMKPSGLTFDVDPDEFRKWAEEPDRMLYMLAGDLKLLQDHG